MKTIKKRFKKEKAFTMIELLLIIGILAVLAGVVIVALNPGVQLAKARNSERIADISDIYKAVQEYYVDNNNWPSSGALTTTLTEICDTNDLPSGCIDLDILVTEGYLTELPTDPQADQGTDYFIALNGVNAIELAARNSTELMLLLDCQRMLRVERKTIRVVTQQTLIVGLQIKIWLPGALGLSLYLHVPTKLNTKDMMKKKILLAIRLMIGDFQPGLN
jgi:type II secretory pathway pseudopilin PulG